MPSKAIASPDAWLVRADEVLREQRANTLSPSSAAVWDDAAVVWTMTLGAFERGLEDLLVRLCRCPGRWILICEDAAHPNRFWQALAYEDGSLIAEVVGNYYLEGDDRLTFEQEAELVRLGWQAPDPPRRPNWLHIEPTTSPDVAVVALQAAESLRRVFDVGHHDEVILKLFGSPRRGGTPAGAEYVAGEPDDAGAEPSFGGRFIRIDPDAAERELETMAHAWVERLLGPIETQLDPSARLGLTCRYP